VQASCQCGQKITIDDSRVPDRPFVVKCPKCQAHVKLPGKSAAEAPAPTPEAEAPAPSEESRAQMMAQVRREMGDVPPAGRALIVLPDRAQAGAMTLTLSRLGFQVESVENPTEASQLLEQGLFSMVVTARPTAAQGGADSLYARLNRLSSDARRRVFVCLVGGDFKTGDGTQAFSVLADLVVNPKDTGTVDAVVRGTLAERQRLYQTFLDVRHRHESTPS
jgi:hypothetical protein